MRSMSLIQVGVLALVLAACSSSVESPELHERSGKTATDAAAESADEEAQVGDEVTKGKQPLVEEKIFLAGAQGEQVEGVRRIFEIDQSGQDRLGKTFAREEQARAGLALDEGANLELRSRSFYGVGCPVGRAHVIWFQCQRFRPNLVNTTGVSPLCAPRADLVEQADDMCRNWRVIYGL